MDICVKLQNLNLITNSITGGQNRLREDFLTGLATLPQSTTRMIEHTMEEVLQRQTKQIEAATSELLRDQNARLDPLIRRPPRQWPTRPQKLKSKQPKNTNPKTEGVAINISQYASICQPTCVCSCHSQVRAPAPAFINRVLGQLFVGTAGIPLLSQKCDYQACKSSQAPQVSVEYWFPLGVFWSQIIRLQVAYHASTGPQFSLRSLRRVPDSARCVHYAMNGNIKGLKELFKRGLASPWDVSSTRGYTLARVSH